MTKCPECGYPSETTIAGPSTCGSCRDAWTRAFSKRRADQDGNVHHWTDVHGIIQAMRGRGPDPSLSAATESIERVRSAAVHAAYETPEPDERVMVDAFAKFWETRNLEDAGRLVWAVAKATKESKR